MSRNIGGVAENRTWVPDLTARAAVKLAEFASLEKGGAAWESEPRIPAGEAGGDQWTTDGGPGIVARPIENTESAPAGGAAREPRLLSLDDGVYRPGFDDPFLIPTSGTEEDEEPRAGSNGPPDDFTSLREVFPGLKNAPTLAIPLAPIDGFLGVSASANAANLDATMLQYRYPPGIQRDYRPLRPHDALIANFRR